MMQTTLFGHNSLANAKKINSSVFFLISVPSQLDFLLPVFSPRVTVKVFVNKDQDFLFPNVNNSAGSDLSQNTCYPRCYLITYFTKYTCYPRCYLITYFTIRDQSVTKAGPNFSCACIPPTPSPSY